jgi:hypothetical protein
MIKISYAAGFSCVCVHLNLILRSFKLYFIKTIVHNPTDFAPPDCLLDCNQSSSVGIND